MRANIIGGTDLNGRQLAKSLCTNGQVPGVQISVSRLRIVIREQGFVAYRFEKGTLVNNKGSQFLGGIS